MILRKLEVYGFKSFADRQTLNFAPGITAVIGPNGCGKSNVVDAFKWVLGEQAPSSIRSKGMSDVLHLDREGKEAVAYAEGSITFDNATGLLNFDAPEVVVTRRIHRDGRSEYLINNSAVRLRMVRDLFLGTGIGTRSYFVLEQGRITDIIKRSPMERRAIFEEAAGIGRYNQRRREAERKLEGVDDNLSRARDVIGEISRQIRSLRIQAGRARSYNETAARLREVRLQAGIIRFDLIHGELAELASRLAEEAREEGRARAAEQQAGQRREASQTLRQLAVEAVQRYRTWIQDNVSRIADWRAGAEKETAQAARFREDAQEKKAETVRLEEALEQRRQELAALDQEHHRAARARRVFVDLRRQKHDEQEDVTSDHEARKSEQESLRHESYETDRQRANLNNRVGVVRVQRGNLEGSLDRLRRRGHELGAQLARLSTARQDAETLSVQMNTTLADAQAAVDRAETVRNDTRTGLADLERRLSGIQVNLKERQGRLEVLEDLEASREGMGEGARFLLERASTGNDRPEHAILGLVGDDLEMDPTHVRAVERTLGDDVEALFTRDVDGALGAADELKRRGKGGAHFWPLSPRVSGEEPASASGGRPSDDVLNRPGVLGWAPDLVRLRRSDHAGVLELLRDVVLVQDREVALALRAHGHTRMQRLVTVEGEIFGPGQRIVAGESWQSGGLLSRRLEIQRVTQEIQALECDRRDGEGERQGVQKALVEAEREVVVSQEHLRDRDLDRARQVKEVDDLRRREKDLLEEKRIGEAEADEIDAERQTLKEEEQSIVGSMEEADQRRDAIRKRESWLEIVLGGVARRLDAIRSEVERVEAAAVAAHRREGELQYRKHQILDRITEMDHTRIRFREEVENLLAWAARSDEARNDLQQKVEDAADARGRWECLLKQAREELTVHEAAHHNAAREEEEARSALDAVRSAREEDRVHQGELRTRLESLVERLRGEENVELASLVQNAARDAARKAIGPVPDEATDANVAGTVFQARGSRAVLSAHAIPPDGAADAGASDRSIVFPALRIEPDASSGDAGEAGPSGPPDLHGLEDEAARLKKKLDRLGPVNVEAISELADLESRESFYLVQERDLNEARKALEDIIRRINRRSRQIFLETFNTIRAEFRSIFRKLFGGGRGDVRLLDEENVLESGVEIVAQPPEKGAKSIDMLSGGEKVMTTIALLFAIFRARPCPFCLLDEIDAALDEANIQRFLDMVNGFLEKTQFIIVTHNKRTIAKADVIHGITMPKAGRSQRVSVKFEGGEARPVDRTVPVFALEDS